MKTTWWLESSFSQWKAVWKVSAKTSPPPPRIEDAGWVVAATNRWPITRPYFACPAERQPRHWLARWQRGRGRVIDHVRDDVAESPCRFGRFDRFGRSVGQRQIWRVRRGFRRPRPWRAGNDADSRTRRVDDVYMPSLSPHGGIETEPAHKRRALQCREPPGPTAKKTQCAVSNVSQTFFFYVSCWSDGAPERVSIPQVPPSEAMAPSG